jgi:diguanylate cyclase (GGDEF)-like protein
LRNEIAERVRVQEQLRHEVMHDALTGLPNRGYLREQLERVLGRLRREPQRRSALLYLDIDRFKVVNDSLGHLAGDAMLQAVATRLQECVREPDLVARLSGDEFAVLLQEVPVPEAAIRVAQRILELLSEPLLLAGKEIEPSASIGIAIADAGYHGADDVLRDADIALYRAKALGRKRFELFDASLQKHAVDVLEMERDLRVALHQDQFVPFFQPIQRLDTDEVVGFEALIRWQHPERGLLAPAQFLPIAEDSGSIEAIDWWMFEHACRLAAHSLGDGRYVALNVSPLHFRRDDFGQRLARMLQHTGLPPSRLVIEVTEGSLLDDPEGVRDSLAWLRTQGIGAALDDFGTGYSSLSYLHTFPLQSVKIDRSFVARLGAEEGNSDAVVVSILALARALGMDAIAEGIETQAQHDTLLAMGCRFGQGYLLGRPAPIAHWQDASR